MFDLLHWPSVFGCSRGHLTCYTLRPLDFVTPVLTNRAMSWLWGLEEMWWTHASPTHSQLKQQLQSLWVWESGGTWSFFPTLRAWLSQRAVPLCEACSFAKGKGVLLDSTGKQQSMKCDTGSEWTRELPGFALNMKAIRDSWKSPATLEGNQRLNRFKGWSIRWHKSECSMTHPLTGISGTTQAFEWLLTPISTFPLFWQTFINRITGDARQQRTDQLCRPI